MDLSWRITYLKREGEIMGKWFINENDKEENKCGKCCCYCSNQCKEVCIYMSVCDNNNNICEHEQ